MSTLLKRLRDDLIAASSQYGMPGLRFRIVGMSLVAIWIGGRAVRRYILLTATSSMSLSAATDRVRGKMELFVRHIRYSCCSHHYESGRCTLCGLSNRDSVRDQDSVIREVTRYVTADVVFEVPGLFASVDSESRVMTLRWNGLRSRLDLSGFSATGPALDAVCNRVRQFQLEIRAQCQHLLNPDDLTCQHCGISLQEQISEQPAPTREEWRTFFTDRQTSPEDAEEEYNRALALVTGVREISVRMAPHSQRPAPQRKTDGIVTRTTRKISFDG